MGVLCDDCCQELSAPPTVSPEQIDHHAVDPTYAALVDVWGRIHRLDAPATIGRSQQSLTILEPSVSRRHAEIQRIDSGWSVRDLGSSNGTFLDDVTVLGNCQLRPGAKLRFGDVSFYFLADTSALPQPSLRRAISQTRAPSEPGEVADTLQIPVQRPATVTFKLYQTTGGGGVAEVEGKRVQLSVAQLELVTLLVTRMLDEIDRAHDERGFVAATEMMKLSLDSVVPSFDTVRQLVRRVRRAFLKSGIGDLIESRHGVGYRLRVLPRLVADGQPAALSDDR